MKTFFLAMAGGFFGVFVALFFWAQYSDYRATSQTQGWVIGSAETMKQIAANAVKENGVDAAGKDVRAPVFFGFRQEQRPTLAEVAVNGTIYLQGGVDGQALVLIPELHGGKVTWRCIGGPTKSMLGACRVASSISED